MTKRLLLPVLFAAVVFLCALPCSASPCGNPETKAATIWNDAVKAEMVDRFVGEGRKYNRKIAKRITKGLDRLTQDWIARRSESCEDTTRSACLDAALVRTKAYVDFYHDYDLTKVRRAYDFLLVLAESQELCEMPYVRAPYAEDAASANQDAVETSEYRRTQSWMARSIENASEARKAAQEAKEAAEHSGSRRLIALALAAEGRIAWDYGPDEVAIASYEKARVLFHENGDRLNEAVVLHRLAETVGERDLDGSIHRCKESLDLMRSVARQRSRWEIPVLVTLAELSGAKKNPMALSYLERAIAISEEIYPKEHTTRGFVTETMAWVYWSNRRYDDALKLYDWIFAQDERIFGRNHPVIGDMYYRLAEMLISYGQRQPSIRYHEKALRIYHKAYGEYDAHTALAARYLGLYCGAEGNQKKALRLQQRALAINEKLHPDGHDEVATDLYLVGDRIGQMGDVDQMIVYYRRHLEMVERLHGSDSLKFADALRWIGESLMHHARYEQALVYIERAFAIEKAHPEVSNPKSAYSLGRCRCILGK